MHTSTPAEVPRPADSSRSSPRWATMAERGSVFALRAMIWIYRFLGRRFALAIMHPTALYFVLTGRKTRRASRDYFEHLVRSPEGRAALGHDPGWLDTYRHVHQFAIALVDRMCAWAGELDNFELQHRAAAHFDPVGGLQSGAIILGSHYGSFDMLRSISLANQVKINVVMYTQNAPSINAFFRRLNPEIEMNVISIGTGSVRSVFEIRGCIERGELVAILADRVAIGDRERAHRVPFLGAPAPFPEGPFTLATMLGCPVLVAEGVRRGDARYEVTSQLFYDGKRVPRSERPAVVKQLLEAYAGHLERCCYDDPYQWFNFYDFWESPQATQQM